MKNILVEFSDEWYKLVSEKELEEMEEESAESDGITGYRVAGEILYKKKVIELIDEMIKDRNDIIKNKSVHRKVLIEYESEVNTLTELRNKLTEPETIKVKF